MMNVKKHFLLLLIGGALSLQLSAQQATADFKKVNEAYQKATSLSMDVGYKLFANYTSASPFESSNGKYIKQNNNYYSELLGIVTVQNAKHKITINQEQKSLILTNPQDAGKSPSPVMLDSMLTLCSKIEFTDLGEGRKLYKLHFATVENFEYDRIDIEIGNNWLLSKLVFFYRKAVILDETNKSLQKEKPRLEITYSSINTQPAISAELFSEKKYIIQSGKSYKAAPAYADYRFLNLKPAQK
ncbi:MAG: hypothetical protein MUC87_22260 [Bacteroidia bacterium]|jgi:hypothetical protein|nr:hypothetical protein [Bacteroidia bacterium]